MITDLVTIDAFSDKVGQAFHVEEADVAAVALTLIEATAMANHGKAPRAPFSLLFTSAGAGVLPQRMYTLRHAALGPRPIFLVPIAQKGEVVTYQAIFN
jgi:hypothetical protein